MSVDEFRTVIERIGHYTNYIYLHVKGEPLLHPQLGEILKICQDADMTVNLTTKDRKSTRQNSSHGVQSRMPSSA